MKRMQIKAAKLAAFFILVTKHNLSSRRRNIFLVYFSIKYWYGRG